MCARGRTQAVCVTYWMNRLQKLPNSHPVCSVTLNPVHEPAKGKTFGVYEFEHPMYDAPSAAARRSVQRIQGRDGLFFAGAWLGDGFHEAGLRTGLEAAFALGGSVPWQATTTHQHGAALVLLPGRRLRRWRRNDRTGGAARFGDTTHVREKPFHRSFRHRIADDRT